MAAFVAVTGHSLETHHETSDPHHHDGEEVDSSTEDIFEIFDSSAIFPEETLDIAPSASTEDIAASSTTSDNGISSSLLVEETFAESVVLEESVVSSIVEDSFVDGSVEESFIDTSVDTSFVDDSVEQPEVTIEESTAVPPDDVNSDFDQEVEVPVSREAIEYKYNLAGGRYFKIVIEGNRSILRFMVTQNPKNPISVSPGGTSLGYYSVKITNTATPIFSKFTISYHFLSADVEQPENVQIVSYNQDKKSWISIDNSIVDQSIVSIEARSLLEAGNNEFAIVDTSVEKRASSSSDGSQILRSTFILSSVAIIIGIL
jgi:hypothetical protein